MLKIESLDCSEVCFNGLDLKMLDSKNENFQEHKSSESMGNVTQIRLAGENAEKVFAVLIESEGKKHELPFLLEEITKNRQEVRDLLKTVAVEQKELEDLYAKLAFQVLNIDRTDTAQE